MNKIDNENPKLNESKLELDQESPQKYISSKFNQINKENISLTPLSYELKNI